MGSTGEPPSYWQEVFGQVGEVGQRGIGGALEAREAAPAEADAEVVDEGGVVALPQEWRIGGGLRQPHNVRAGTAVAVLERLNWRNGHAHNLFRSPRVAAFEGHLARVDLKGVEGVGRYPPLWMTAGEVDGANDLVERPQRQR